MLQEERHKIILQQITLHHKVLSNDLCLLLNVSLDTVRRDLAELEKDGKIIKVHGGALAKTFHQPFQQPAIYAQAEKKKIAEKALKLIHDGMSILTGGGTIMLELAKIIPPDLIGTFFTVSPLVALEVAQRSSVNVILLAGQLSPNSYICTGASVVSQLSEIHADLCFLGTNALSLGDGLTEYDWETVQVKKSLIKSAKKVAVMSISEKLETNHKLQVCKINALDYLITDLDPGDKKLLTYSQTCKII
ncbi:DeoR/GlpR family DNA-binding transcription regulator [Daejeonella lutea]|uniref:Transcriptional regulator, DeoR family n=1 Tax=Daejeonella lutea TaxID=572036 RepID=A0A1T5BEQ4_9SPHI|nr:DeoR/GlpR family DNA-binding transcription regulator [Daejeonella lutea]SKB45784.1 transcriptional regulator, DeoR family [Daejeonella lutea]